MIFPSNWVIFTFHVNFQGCMLNIYHFSHHGSVEKELLIEKWMVLEGPIFPRMTIHVG